MENRLMIIGQNKSRNRKCETLNVKSDFSHLFLLVLLLLPLLIIGNFQNVSALTPVADLTGDWSGLAQITDDEEHCTFTGNVNAHLEQDGNNIAGTYLFAATSAEQSPDTPEWWDCSAQDVSLENAFLAGTVDGSRITLFSAGRDFDIVLSGWYASSGIKLDIVSEGFFTGTTLLSPTNFTPPLFDPILDTDGDGIPDSTDSCTTQKETVNGYQDTDGCPDVVPPTDTDGDGILDSTDSCLTQKETVNGYQDTDGCPDVVPPKQTTPPTTSEEVPIDGETPRLLRDEPVDDVYKKMYEELKLNDDGFDINPNLGFFDSIFYSSLPVLGKVSEGTVVLRQLGGGEGWDVHEGEPLRLGDIVTTGEKSAKLDWGGAETVLGPNSVFMVGGDPENLREHPTILPHHIEIIEGQIRLYKIFKQFDPFEVQGKATFIFKVGKKPIAISGTDVIISHNKTTETSIVYIHEGTVKVFDDASKEIKEFGAGNTLVINDVGVTQTKTLSEQTWDSLVSDSDLQVSTPTPPQEETPKTITPGTKEGGCLIATATYGSELAPQVQQLRELRDNSLLQTASGTSFMNTFNDFYYSFSPTIADWERENPVFKETVKITLTPMISSLSILNYVDMDSEVSVLGYGISLIILNLGMYFVAPAIVIHTIRKKF